jgi:hypothetical protein
MACFPALYDLRASQLRAFGSFSDGRWSLKNPQIVILLQFRRLCCIVNAIAHSVPASYVAEEDPRK